MNPDKIEVVIFEWDVRTWSRALSSWNAGLNTMGARTLHALEVGGRNGGLSLWLAEKDIKVICSDICNTAELASGLHGKSIAKELITYQFCDAVEMDYENEFDVIIFKSVLGGIGHNNQKIKQDHAMMRIHKALKPGGILLFSENLTASPVHRFFRKRFVKWGSAWRYVNPSELNQWLSVYQSVDVRYTGFLATFGRSEKQRNVLAIIDSWFLLWWMPNSWKYVAYGTAIKH